MAAKLFLVRSDRPGQTELDFDTIGAGIEKLAHAPTLYGHRVRGFDLHHPMGDLPWTVSIACTDSLSGEWFTFEGIFRD